MKNKHNMKGGYLNSEQEKRLDQLLSEPGNEPINELEVTRLLKLSDARNNDYRTCHKFLFFWLVIENGHVVRLVAFFSPVVDTSSLVLPADLHLLIP